MSRVLVVDDEPDILRLIGFSLTSHGFEILEAADGFSAIDLARAHRPDLILLDVMMPGLDGYEACRRLKADRDTSAIPVAMLTAKTQVAEQEHGLDCGAIAYICKPFTPKDLVAQVRAILGE